MCPKIITTLIIIVSINFFHKDICRCCVHFADKMGTKVERIGETESAYGKKFEVTHEVRPFLLQFFFSYYYYSYLLVLIKVLQKYEFKVMETVY